VDSEQRRNLATTTIGTGLVASGGVARHSAVRQAERIKKLPRKSGALPSAILRHGGLGRQRALWLAGAAGGFAGATGMGVGASNMVRDWKGGKADEQKDAIKPFWQEGLSGTAQATRDRLNEARKPKPHWRPKLLWRAAPGRSARWPPTAAWTTWAVRSIPHCCPGTLEYGLLWPLSLAPRPLLPRCLPPTGRSGTSLRVTRPSRAVEYGARRLRTSAPPVAPARSSCALRAVHRRVRAVRSCRARSASPT
jgi:hypothetical protein